MLLFSKCGNAPPFNILEDDKYVEDISQFPLRILLIYTSTISHTPVSLLRRTLSIQLIHIAFPEKHQPIKLELLKIQLLSILLTWWKFISHINLQKRSQRLNVFHTRKRNCWRHLYFSVNLLF